MYFCTQIHVYNLIYSKHEFSSCFSPSLHVCIFSHTLYLLFVSRKGVKVEEVDVDLGEAEKVIRIVYSIWSALIVAG